MISEEEKLKFRKIGAICEYAKRPKTIGHYACCCLGPQNNEPVCPCDMQNIVKIDDIYFKITEELIYRDDIPFGYQFVASVVEYIQKNDEPKLTLKERLHLKYPNK